VAQKVATMDAGVAWLFDTPIAVSQADNLMGRRRRSNSARA
jgi:hypothetical protein